MKSSVITKNSLIALILLAVLVTANILIFFLPTMQTTAEKDLSFAFPDLTDVNVLNKTVYDNGKDKLAGYTPEMALSKSAPTVGAYFLHEVLSGRRESAYSKLTFTSFTGNEEVYYTIRSLDYFLSDDYKFTYFFGDYTYEDYVNRTGIYGSFGVDCLSYFHIYSYNDMYLYAIILIPHFNEQRELTYSLNIRFIANPWNNPLKVDILTIDNIYPGNRSYGDVGFVTLDLSAIFSPTSDYEWRAPQNFVFDHIMFRISPGLDMSGITSKSTYVLAQSYSPMHMSLIDDAIISNHLEYLDFQAFDINKLEDIYYQMGYGRGYDAGVVDGSKLESGIIGFFPSVFQGFGSFVKTVLDFEVFGISVLKVVGVIGLLILLFMFIRLLR